MAARSAIVSRKSTGVRSNVLQARAERGCMEDLIGPFRGRCEPQQNPRGNDQRDEDADRFHVRRQRRARCH